MEYQGNRRPRDFEEEEQILAEFDNHRRQRIENANHQDNDQNGYANHQDNDQNGHANHQGNDQNGYANHQGNGQNGYANQQGNDQNGYANALTILIAVVQSGVTIDPALDHLAKILLLQAPTETRTAAVMKLTTTTLATDVKQKYAAMITTGTWAANITPTQRTGAARYIVEASTRNALYTDQSMVDQLFAPFLRAYIDGILPPELTHLTTQQVHRGEFPAMRRTRMQIVQAYTEDETKPILEILNPATTFPLDARRIMIVNLTWPVLSSVLTRQYAPPTSNTAIQTQLNKLTREHCIHLFKQTETGMAILQRLRGNLPLHALPEMGGMSTNPTEVSVTLC